MCVYRNSNFITQLAGLLCESPQVTNETNLTCTRPAKIPKKINVKSKKET